MKMTSVVEVSKEGSGRGIYGGEEGGEVGEELAAVGEVGEQEKPVRYHITCGLRQTQVGVLKYTQKSIACKN